MITEQKAIDDVQAIIDKKADAAEGVQAQGFGVFAQVVSGLKGQGFGPIAIWSMVKLILELIEEFGPQVEKIIERIKEIFSKK